MFNFKTFICIRPGEIESISRDSSSGSESRPSTLNAQQDTMEANFFGASSASLVGSSSESEVQKVLLHIPGDSSVSYMSSF